MNNQWYCSIASQQYGPVPFEQLLQWVAEGRLQPDHHVCLVGQQQWSVVRDVPQLIAAAPSHNANYFAPQQSAAGFAPTPTADNGFQINTGASSGYSSSGSYSSSRTKGRGKDSTLQWLGGGMVTVLVFVGLGARIARIALRHNDAAEQRAQELAEQRQAELRQRKLISDISRPPPTHPGPSFDINEFNRENRKLQQPWRK